jgi:hypothetical protein
MFYNKTVPIVNRKSAAAAFPQFAGVREKAGDNRLSVSILIFEAGCARPEGRSGESLRTGKKAEKRSAAEAARAQKEGNLTAESTGQKRRRFPRDEKNNKIRPPRRPFVQRQKKVPAPGLFWSDQFSERAAVYSASGWSASEISGNSAANCSRGLESISPRRARAPTFGLKLPLSSYSRRYCAMLRTTPWT